MKGQKIKILVVFFNIKRKREGNRGTINVT